MKITKAEILEQIAASIEERQKNTPEDDPYAFTSRELVEVIGISVKRMRVLLRSMIESGDVEATQDYRTTISGVTSPVAAYKFIIK